MKYSVTSLSDSGEDAKVKGTQKVGGAGKKGKRNGPFSPHFPPILFLCSGFLNSAGPIISEPGTGYFKYYTKIT